MQIVMTFFVMIAGFTKEAFDFAFKDRFSNRHRQYRLSTKGFYGHR